MTPSPADDDRVSVDVSTVNEDDVNNRRVLRQAQLARELHEVDAMLANKQELAKQMMRSDEQLASVKLQYEVNYFHLTAVCTGGNTGNLLELFLVLLEIVG